MNENTHTVSVSNGNGSWENNLFILLIRHFQFPHFSFSTVISHIVLLCSLFCLIFFLHSLLTKLHVFTHTHTSIVSYNLGSRYEANYLKRVSDSNATDSLDQ